MVILFILYIFNDLNNNSSLIIYNDSNHIAREVVIYYSDYDKKIKISELRPGENYIHKYINDKGEQVLKVKYFIKNKEYDDIAIPYIFNAMRDRIEYSINDRIFDDP